MEEKKKIKVMIGLSGGVDSAVAAYLLMKQGYEVAGGFMRNWDAIANGDYLGNPTLNESQCPQEKDYQDALLVAEKLGIPLYRIDETSCNEHPLSDFRVAIEQVVNSYGIKILDLKDKMGAAKDNPYIADGLHPNDLGHRYLAELISEYIQNTLLNN